MEHNEKLSKLIGKVTRCIDERPYESKMAFLGMIAGAAECVDERLKNHMDLKRTSEKSSLV